MYNKVVMVGYLARDLEQVDVSKTNGAVIVNSAIASTRRYKDKNGDKKEETCFIDVTFFNRIGEIARDYLKKGSKVLIEGSLKQNTWVDQATGTNRTRHSINVENLVMLDNKDSSAPAVAPATTSSAKATATKKPAASKAPKTAPSEDDFVVGQEEELLPF